MDLTKLTDEELDEHRIAVLCEQERRANLAQIPTQISELREKYIDGGGDPADLAQGTAMTPTRTQWKQVDDA